MVHMPNSLGFFLVPLIVGSEAAYVFHRARNYTGLDHAGYAVLSDELPGSLLLSRFGATPFVGKSEVTLLDLESGSETQLATSIDWPNLPAIVDKSVFGFKAAVVGAGFLVPSHTMGGIWIIELSEKPEVLKAGPVKVSRDSSESHLPDSGWFYHQAYMVDMNNDGRLDILTSRCADSVEPWNPKGAKLVWLEHPASGALNGSAWVEHVLMDGPDFLFEVAPPEVSGTNLGLCAAEYLSEKLVYIEGSVQTGFKRIVVDENFGHGFGCKWADLNGDGRIDLVATNHLNQNGSVFAYDWAGNLADGNADIRKHVLATGYSAMTKDMGKASPGDAIPFFPRAQEELHEKPLIVVSADNGNYVDVLIPKAQEDPNDWTYQRQLVEYMGGDVGRIAIGDTDGDGWNELFVPVYDIGQVIKYTIRKEDATIFPASSQIMV